MLNSASAISFLMFNMLCAPCFAAIGALHRELGTWRDTLIAVIYQCVYAYLIALALYGIASLVYDVSISPLVLVATVVVIALFAYLLVAKDPFKQLDQIMEEKA